MLIARPPALLVTALVLLVPAIGLVPQASAVVSSAKTIDGPSADLLELGGVAMAEDGSGGLVYLKRSAGRAHVFAARFEGGRWLQPQRVDVGQGFDSSWPRIGAGDGGRLVVTWVQENGPGSDRLFSASIDPGGSGFQPPVPVDLNVGEATATYPSLAMNPGGAAYLSYRVVTQTGNSGLPPGYVYADTRIARYGGSFWTQLGSTANRNPSSPVTTPSLANSPKVDIDINGSGIIAFQEPDDDLVDRVWARRMFGSTLGIPLLVSPRQIGDVPLRGPADGFAISGTALGGAAVAFRQQPGERSPLAGPHIVVNTILDSFVPGAGDFGTSRVADGPPRTSLSQAPGIPDVSAVTGGAFLLAYGLGSQSLFASGNDTSIGSPARLADFASAVAGDPRVELAESGAAAAAWKVSSSGRAGALVQERRSDGVTRARPVSAAAGGPVNSLETSGSGLGDALVAFQQGAGDRAAIAAAVVDAPPLDFNLQTPDGWVRSKRVGIGWDRARDGFGSVTYAITVSGASVVRGVKGHRASFRAARVGNGKHRVSVTARDVRGQKTRSVPAVIKIDRRKPRVRVRRASHGRAVTVRIYDGPKRRSSGPMRRRASIVFGDGKKVRRAVRARHVYRRGGVYRVTVRASDRAGNRVVLKRKVRVR